MKTAALVLGFLSFAALPAAADGAPRRPNVVLIMTDDQGYGDIHSHGNDLLDTPNLDKLAAEGARFERFYVSPICGPTRAALMTGHYPQRTGGGDNNGALRGWYTDEVTIAQILKTAGYATGCYGKWHGGEVWPYHPNARGFDEFYGFCGGHHENRFDTTLERNGRIEKMDGYMTDALTDAAIALVRAKKEKPFFCYLPYNAVHWPLQVPRAYYDKYVKRGVKGREAAIFGMVENIDANVGRILKELDALGLAEDTLVIFLCDNGPDRARYNGGMSGVKGSSLEGGIRVPCFMRWPRRIKSGMVVKPIAAHIDILPTVAAACGVENPKTLPLDGVNLLPLLEGRTDGWPDRKLFAAGAVQYRRWRLCGGKLYDIEADPAQRKDVALEHPDVVEELAAARSAWAADVARSRAGRPPRPFPVGHARQPTVFLHVYWAAWKGLEGYRHACASYVKDWKRTDGSLSWTFEVVSAGRYEAALWHTCPAEAVGTKVRIETGGAAVEGVLEKAHDPDPMAGRDYVNANPEKSWTAAPIGVLDLPAGETTLTLRVTRPAGAKGFDLKALRLTRAP